MRLHHPHSGGGDSSDKVPESLSPHRIELDRDDVDGSVREREGDGARAGPDLDDQLTTPEAGLRDQSVSDLRTKEVLAETATSLVPGCPPVAGHCGSPW